MTQKPFETLDIPVSAFEPGLSVPLSIPAEMIVEIATGFEDPKVIASRYGFDDAQWEKLSQWKPFLDSVASQKNEFELNGNTFRLKAKVLTEDVFENAYKIAKSHDATLMQKLEFVKLGAKLADMEPKPAAKEVAQGSGFSITINMGTHKSKDSQTIDITPAQIEDKSDE